MVVVTRWYESYSKIFCIFIFMKFYRYGGILLGPDRFKHINECCRQILEEHGYVDVKQKCKRKKN